MSSTCCPGSLLNMYTALYIVLVCRYWAATLPRAGCHAVLDCKTVRLIKCPEAWTIPQRDSQWIRTVCPASAAQEKQSGYINRQRFLALVPRAESVSPDLEQPPLSCRHVSDHCTFPSAPGRNLHARATGSHMQGTRCTNTISADRDIRG